MWIDAHQHYWQISRNNYGWITPDLNVLYRDFFPSELIPYLQKYNISKTIVVQAAPTVAETEFLLNLSAQEESISGVVGWLDLMDPMHYTHFERFSQHTKFVGFRVMIQDMDQPSDILNLMVIDAFRHYAELETPIDLLVKAHQLPVVLRLLEAVPHLRGVIDHIAKPDIAHAVFEPWKSQISEIAQFPNVYCKLSGMVTEAEHKNWKPQTFVEYVHHVISAFGPSRVMYGSDWPVCLLSASYDEVWELANSSLPTTITSDDKSKVFGINAATFYKLNI